MPQTPQRSRCKGQRQRCAQEYMTVFVCAMAGMSCVHAFRGNKAKSHLDGDSLCNLHLPRRQH